MLQGAVLVVLVLGLVIVWFRNSSQKKRTKPEDWQVREYPNLVLGKDGGLIVELTCDQMPLSFFAIQSRRLLLYIPEQFTVEKKSTERVLQGKERKIPSVVIFHSPKYTAYTFYKRCVNSQGKTWQELANEKGFVIIFAEAMRRSCRDTPTNLALWVFDENDETYLQSSLDYLFHEYTALDRKRVFAAGYSSRTKRDLGALFSASIAVQMNSFAGVAHYEGTLLSSKIEMSNMPREHTNSSLRKPIESVHKGIKTPLFYVVTSAKQGKEGEGEVGGEEGGEEGEVRCASVIKFLKGQGWPLQMKTLPSPVRQMRDHHSVSPSSMQVELVWGFFQKISEDRKKK